MSYIVNPLFWRGNESYCCLGFNDSAKFEDSKNITLNKSISGLAIFKDQPDHRIIMCES